MKRKGMSKKQLRAVGAEMHLPADWAIKMRQSTHKSAKDHLSNRNSKLAKRELRNDLKGE